jgi:hypothetical protein
VANEETLFRRRPRDIVIRKYGSLDRFYLETDFSNGHLSQIPAASKHALGDDGKRWPKPSQKVTRRDTGSTLVIHVSSSAALICAY